MKPHAVVEWTLESFENGSGSSKRSERERPGKIELRYHDRVEEWIKMPDAYHKAAERRFELEEFYETPSGLSFSERAKR